jgi:hypothetical protein
MFFISSLKRRARDFIVRAVNESLMKYRSTSVQPQIAQKILQMQFIDMYKSGNMLENIQDAGFRVFSENDEDGILLYIFSLIGMGKKRLVDIGAGISGSNTANLIINHGWTGLLIEGSLEQVDALKKFYGECPDTRNYQPRVIREWITRDNVERLILQNGMGDGIDLLSIDIDGIDFYVWQSITNVSPRVVVVEFQCILGPVNSLVVPYQDSFECHKSDRFGIYNSASLAAFVKLGKEKGYRLVGVNRYGYNAFFVRDDIATNILPEVNAIDCFKHPFYGWAKDEFLEEALSKEWVKV